MKPELRRFGESRSPVVVIDDFSGTPEAIVDIAAALAPYPPLHNYYPGLRRVIERKDADADLYVTETCERASQFIAGAFDIERFDLIEASFSLVTSAPADLSPAQRAPHFDSTESNYFALLHYLRVPSESGTAFYRQRDTGIERVTEGNLTAFVRSAEATAARLADHSGYITGSDEYYEQIGAVEALPDRLIIYQGSLLHSGIIPPTMPFSADPREGRLTANLFIRGH